jgi:hypothetical protein
MAKENLSKSLSRRNLLKFGRLGAVASTLPASFTAVKARPSTGASGYNFGDVVSVKDFGAKGDGHTICTRAINRAIDVAAANGGTVYFPAGTYASYSIHLKNNVALYLAEGATLLAAAPADGQGYDHAESEPRNHYQAFGIDHWRNSLIWGENLENVSIFGPGRIDGAGLVAKSEESRPGQGNKTIALKLCHNVTIKDITIVTGGHFCMLFTGVDNLRVDSVVIDANRDGIDVDCCRNVRISNCAVNSPNDDAIVLKSSYALNEARVTENVTIDNCIVSGYAIGSLVEGTFKIANRDRPTGRVKMGTESNGGFKNITISNVVFDHCRGLALETVDGGQLEDVTISNISMRELSSAAFFLRLGSRLRGPAGTTVGALRRVNINNVVASNVDPRYSSSIVGIPGHAIEDVSFSDIRILYKGGLSLDDVGRPENPYNVPEKASAYPEPDRFGVLPAYGFYIRHAREIEMTNVKVGFMETDKRPAFVLEDVHDIDFHHDEAEKAPAVPTFVLRNVEDFTLTNSRPVESKHLKSVKRKAF